VQDDALELNAGRARISRQASLTLAMLVLLPTAAVLTAMTALLQYMIKSSHPHAAVWLLVGLGMLLLDIGVVLFAVTWWVTHRARKSSARVDSRGVTLRLGSRATFLPWAEFSRLSTEDATLLGWLRPDSLQAAHPMVARLPKRNADEHGNVGLVLGTLADVSGSLHRLREWLGPDLDVALGSSSGRTTMIRALLIIIGIVGLVVGIRRATGTQSMVRSGNYKGAGAALASGLVLADVAFTVAVLGISWSIFTAIGALVVGTLAAGAGGRMLFNDIQKQVSGG
jgi:hypothetical protein